MLTKTQRSMARLILGKRRKIMTEELNVVNGDSSDGSEDNFPEAVLREPYVDWIKRVTRESNEKMDSFKITEWVCEQRRRKWMWAGHCARRSDDRWTKKVLQWSPHGFRDRKRPVTRWSDDMRRWCGDDWTKCAESRARWIELGRASF